MATSGDIGGTIFFIIIVLLLIIAMIYLVFYTLRKIKEKRTQHVELYFDEHFRDIIKEWDLVPQRNVNDWTKGISKRLDTVGNDINKMMDFKNAFDKRISSLESDLNKLEKV
jgi:archaellum component FlaC